MSGRGRLILGTSGFAYRHWRDAFYPPKTPQSQWLEAYADRFSSVELNVSFYRLPTSEAFADWAARTPDDFRFVVKGSRTITHYRRLKNAEEPVARLFDAASGLGSKLSCLLWQLAPRTAPDASALDSFCYLLARHTDALPTQERVRHAFEFRDPRWFADDVLEVLRSHRHCLVFADPPREEEPRLLTSDYAYMRFHHGPRTSGAYEDDELAPYAERAAGLLDLGMDVFAYFNNDPGAWAPRNADMFRQLVKRSR